MSHDYSRELGRLPGRGTTTEELRRQLALVQRETESRLRAAERSLSDIIAALEKSTGQSLTALRQTADGLTEQVEALDEGKVDAAEGMGLSANDYTDEEKTKLAGIEAGANAYTHPAYTARTGKPAADQTPGFGGTFTVSQITSDAAGHVTGATDRTVTIPAAPATGSTPGLMSAADKDLLTEIRKYLVRSGPIITTQPENVTAAAAGNVTVSVKALGDGLAYAWWYKNPGASSWTKSSMTTSSFRVSLTAANSGREVYCIVSDGQGRSVQSETVVITLAE